MQGYFGSLALCTDKKGNKLYIECHVNGMDDPYIVFKSRIPLGTLHRECFERLSTCRQRLTWQSFVGAPGLMASTFLPANAIPHQTRTSFASIKIKIKEQARSCVLTSLCSTANHETLTGSTRDMIDPPEQRISFDHVDKGISPSHRPLLSFINTACFN